MKYLLLLLPLSAAAANTYVLDLSQFDQEKLAEFVERLPPELRNRSVQELTYPMKGSRVISEFPIEDRGFKFLCESHYYHRSRYASSASCKVSIDITHPDVGLGNDEYQIYLDDPSISGAMFKAISYGRPAKEFRSEQREEGIGFDGRRKSVFRYFFRCFPDNCTLKFSSVSGIYE
jgi:hypothetical protein